MVVLYGLLYGRVTARNGGSRPGKLAAPPKMRLHIYNHCPFCVKVMLAYGWAGVEYEQKVCRYGEGALSFATHICFRYRDSAIEIVRYRDCPYNRAWGRENDRRPSSGLGLRRGRAPQGQLQPRASLSSSAISTDP